jgi:DNA polymerase I-like protein with 3'-5' exonuclease and polymerase domains
MLNDDKLATTSLNGVKFTCWSGVGNSKLHLVHTMDEWRAFYALLEQQDLVACDTETTGFQWYKNDRIVGMSFGWKDMHFYVACRHEESMQAGPPPEQINIEDVKDDLIKFFSKPTRTTVWHNAKFDLHFYEREGIRVNTKIHDTRILWHFYDENAPGALKIIASGWKDEMGHWHKGVVDGAASVKEKQLSDWRSKESKLRREAFRKLVMAKADELATDFAYQHLKRNDLKKHIAETILKDHKYANSGKEEIHYGIIPLSLMTEYAALDTFLTYKVYEFCVKNISWTPGLTALYRNEMGLLQALFDAETHGVRINTEHLEKSGEELLKQISELELKIRSVLGDINLSSTQQMADALQKHGVVLTKATEATSHLEEGDEDKRFAVDKGVLEKLKSKHDVVRDILKLREHMKIKNTYVDGILEKTVNGNVLHCSFNQNVSTGRMSSQDPNLQNIPARDKTIRKAFVPWSDEYTYVFADYSQIEVRLTAHYSRDPLLLDAYAKNQDIHTRTCCEMFGFNIDEFTAVLKDEAHPKNKEYSLLRNVAKRINFGIIYGVGAPGLSEQIDRPAKYKDATEAEWVAACQGFIDQYLNKYQGVKRFVNQGNRLVRKEAEVTNYFGRVRHLPHAKATKMDESLYWMEARAQRQGVNFLIQGTAADLFKIAVVRIHNLLKGKKSKLVNFVHDEVQIYLHKSETHLLPEIKKAMESWTFCIPIVAEFSYSDSSWGEKKALHL